MSTQQMNEQANASSKINNKDIIKSKCWIETFTGQAFFPYMPELEKINIDDIAHALSQQCRFSGHTKVFYSVAQHCCLVSDHLEAHGRDLQLTGLLHDATEAYCIDLPSPIKAVMPEFKELEKIIWQAICKRFGLLQCENTIKKADIALLMAEREQLMPMATPWQANNINFEPYTKPIKRWSPYIARRAFLSRFYKLTDSTPRRKKLRSV